MDIFYYNSIGAITSLVGSIYLAKSSIKSPNDEYSRIKYSIESRIGLLFVIIGFCSQMLGSIISLMQSNASIDKTCLITYITSISVVTLVGFYAMLYFQLPKKDSDSNPSMAPSLETESEGT